MGGNEEEAARLFSGIPIERTTGNEQKLKFRKLNLNARICFYHEDGQTLEPASQRGFRISSVELLKICLDMTAGSML